MHKDEELTARVKELWEQNVSQKEMLRIIQDEGFDVSERELMRLRGRHRWLLRAPNGVSEHQGTRAETVVVDDHDDSQQLQKKKAQPWNKGMRLRPSEQDEQLVQRHQQELAKRQAESDERLAARKRRRRTRGWGGLPADPEGPPRFPSETTLDESKVVLQMDNEAYRQMREEFQNICEEAGVIKKTIAGPEKWQEVKDQLVRDNEHLNRVIQHDDTDTLEQKMLSLDVVCQDVTKRMRTMKTRITIADAKNTLAINPEEARTLRSSFYAKLKNDHFISKTDLGPKRWEELKQEWIMEFGILQRQLDPSDPNHKEKARAVEFLARDVMKRLRDDQAKLVPEARKSTKTGPGPGPAYPNGKRTGKQSDSMTRSEPLTRQQPVNPRAAAAANDVLAAQLLQASASDMQIDPSLLLAASGALPDSQDDEQQQQSSPSYPYQDAPAHPPMTMNAPQYAPQPGPPAPEMGIWMRLHPHSPVQLEPAIWLAKISTGTFTELRQKATSEHPGTEAVRIDGIVKDAMTGNEINYSIDDDMKLNAYLSHASGGSATFVVQLAWPGGGMESGRSGF